MDAPISFGTDGWRGIIAEDFTFYNVRACAQGLASYLDDAGLRGQRLIVGYDTRFSSDAFAVAAAEVMAANGIKVLLTPKAVPTPVVSYGVVQTNSAGAIIITASHNPPEWNGLKIKSANGASATSKMTSELEQRIAFILSRGSVKRIPLVEAIKKGSITYFDPVSPYMAQLARLVDLDGLRRADLNIIIDSMHGSGARYLHSCLSGNQLRLTEIRSDPNPSFPGMHQPEPIVQNLTGLSSLVKQVKASVGVATDGDADRVGIIDENGEFITQLQVFALLCLYLLEVRNKRGPMVKTTTTTSMVFRLAELFDVKAHETPVGFKYVAPLMMSEGAIIGGEESGGYGFQGHVPERDGILASLYFLDFMVKTGKTPSQLIAHLYNKVGPHYYDRLDLSFPPQKRQQIITTLAEATPSNMQEKDVVNIDRSEGLRLSFSDGSWLFLRLSGTEPIMRIYAESPSPAESTSLILAGRKIVGV